MNKQQYLAARQQWKRDYVAAQQQIRNSKHAISEGHRALSACGPYVWSNSVEAQERNKRWALAHSQVINATRELRSDRKAMEEHLKALCELKEIARQAWLSRSEVAA